MCTLTIVPIAGAEPGFRVAFNRDELIGRAPGTTPRIARPPAQTAPSTAFVRPLDPVGGGTWIAANDQGLVFALLNRTPIGTAGRSSPSASRGLVIPRLATAGDLDEVRARLGAAVRGVTSGFRLVVTDGRDLLEVLGGLEHSRSLAIDQRPLHNACLRASSGLGDEIVIPPRRRTFATVFGAASEQPMSSFAEARDRQNAFHRSRDPIHPESAVDMERDEARTVSATRIEVTRREVRWTHLEDGPAGDPTAELSLPLRRSPLAMRTVDWSSERISGQTGSGA